MIVSQHKTSLIIKGKDRRKSLHVCHDFSCELGKANIVSGMLLGAFGHMELGVFKELGKDQAGAG